MKGVKIEYCSSEECECMPYNGMLTIQIPGNKKEGISFVWVVWDEIDLGTILRGLEVGFGAETSELQDEASKDEGLPFCMSQEELGIRQSFREKEGAFLFARECDRLVPIRGLAPWQAITPFIKAATK